MGIQAPAEVKFALIHEAVQSNCLLNISTMCEIAGVSRSGYYSWCQQVDYRVSREEQDKADFERILVAYRYRGYAKGARGIHMKLLRNNPPVIMNVKKIRRLMQKYGLKCPIRKANPYRRMAKAIATNAVAPNLVNREFEAHGARAIILTDITYLFYPGGKCYLSVMKDAYTKEVLAYRASPSLEVDFVLECVESLVADHGIALTAQTIVHSDQGSHYTSHAFIDLLKDKELRQSMSRRANCWDNAPQESFFGHMKDDIDLSRCQTFEDVAAVIDDYMDYYNNERYQWELLKLSPVEYYQYVTTGVYPLAGLYDPKGRGSAPDPGV